MSYIHLLRPPSHRGEDSDILKTLAYAPSLNLKEKNEKQAGNGKNGRNEKDSEGEEKSSDIFEIQVIQRFHRMFHKFPEHASSSLSSLSPGGNTVAGNNIPGNIPKRENTVTEREFKNVLREYSR